MTAAVPPAPPPAADAAPPAPVLTAEGVSKLFGRTRALNGARLEVAAGEVHALLGANGAGKSTLSKVIAGQILPDAGSLRLRGSALAPRHTRDALDAGIALVMQETSLAPDLTVLENIFLPELGRPGRLDRAALRRRASAILADLGQHLPLDAEVARLGAAQRQLVEIAKALALDAGLLILDEPTAALSAPEVERLFDVMARLRAQGRAQVFVSHRLEEVLEITDRVTVMREGATVAAGRPTAGLTQAEIVRLMVGRDIGAVYDRADAHPVAASAPVALAVEHLAAAPAVRDVGFAVRQGEILGLGGLVGAGRSEALEAIFGLRRPERGRILLGGREAAIRRPADAVRAGIGFVAEDRRRQNLVPDLSVRENLMLAHLGQHRGFGLGTAARRAEADALLRSLDLAPETMLDRSILAFSGGMQQKVILARWLLLKPRVLLLDEPTKGVDIGTRQSIYRILRRIAAEGTAIVLVSSDFEELLGVAQRVVVIADGRTVAEADAAALDEEKLTLLAAPRASMARNTALLERLARAAGGAAFWALIDGGQVICLNRAVAAPEADPGLAPGAILPAAATAIPQALAARDGQPREDAGGRATLLVPLASSRGHDLGWIGVTRRGPAASLNPAAIAAEIEGADV